MDKLLDLLEIVKRETPNARIRGIEGEQRVFLQIRDATPIEVWVGPDQINIIVRPPHSRLVEDFLGTICRNLREQNVKVWTEIACY